MARGVAVEQAGQRGTMLLMVSSTVWEALVAQARYEGTSPAAVLTAALQGYLEDHGGDEAKDLMR